MDPLFEMLVALILAISKKMNCVTVRGQALILFRSLVFSTGPNNMAGL